MGATTLLALLLSSIPANGFDDGRWLSIEASAPVFSAARRAAE
jgi:hypothetical protein